MIGFYDSIPFEVSRDYVQTFSKLSETAGAAYADISLISGKPRKQFVGASLRTVELTMELRADIGSPPRETLEEIREMAEAGMAGYLVIGGKPVSDLPFVIKSLGAEWGHVFRSGELASVKLTLSLEEYN